MKSKTRAIRTITTTRVTIACTGLTVLDLYVLQSVRHVLAVVCGLFEKLVNLLELHDSDGVGLFFKQLAYRIAAQLIRSFLQPVDLNAMVHERLSLGECSESLLQGCSAGLQDAA